VLVLLLLLVQLLVIMLLLPLLLLQQLLDLLLLLLLLLLRRRRLLPWLMLLPRLVRPGLDVVLHGRQEGVVQRRRNESGGGDGTGDCQGEREGCPSPRVVVL